MDDSARFFEEWKQACLAASSSSSSAAAAAAAAAASTDQELESKAHEYFKSLSEAQSEQSLALLIQSLQQPLTETRLQCRKAALACLKGAFKHDPSSLPGDALSSSAGMKALSLAVVKLLGDFLLQHCGPILVQDVVDPLVDDLDEQVRDNAVQTISTLLLIPTRTSGNDESLEQESIQYRTHLSQQALKRRCAVPDEDQDHGGNPTGNDQVVTPRGLASLPRSRRSTCFQLLQSTLVGLEPLLNRWLDPQQDTNPGTVSALLPWVELCIHSLHGESDPRCLIQLLALLADIQRICRMALRQQFPLEALFDAVSAYYPIQFTPPPNMAHAVTKQDLVRALWKVLSCTEYDAARKQAGRETLFSMTLGLILDQLLPLEDEEPATLLEQRDALVDLKNLLGVINDENYNTVVDVQALSQQLVEPSAIVQIARALKTVHAATAIPAVAQPPSSLTTTPQQVSLQCRDLVSALALACERQLKQEPRYWNGFVRNVVSEIISVGDKVQHQWSRQDIVFLACLAGCGGVKTLQQVLDQSLPAFLKVVSNTQDLFGDEDFAVARAGSHIGTALYGIAALLAGVQTTLQRIRPLVLTPHPLQPHAVAVLGTLLQLWKQTTSDVDASLSTNLFSLHLALVRGLETALMVLPSEVLEQQQMEEVKIFLQDLFDKTFNADANDWTDEEKQFAHACSRTLGIALGEAMNQDSTAGDYSILRSDAIRPDLAGRIFHLVLKDFSSQNGQVIMAVTCAHSKGAAQAVVDNLVSVIMARIQSNIQGQSTTIQDIASVLTRGGRNTSEAFQRSPFLKELRLFLPQRSVNAEIHSGVSTLVLPKPAEEEAVEEAETGELIELLEPLLSIYSSYVDPDHLSSLLLAITKVVPPLDSNDKKRFEVLLPFLSSALQQQSSANRDLDKEVLAEMISFLPDFILSNASPTARAYAASCLNSMLLANGPDLARCPCLEILEENVMPTVLRLLDDANAEAKKKTSNRDKLEATCKELAEALLFAGSIASSAIQRSGTSSFTADKTVKFLVDIACCGKAEFSATKGPIEADMSVADSAIPGAATYLAVAASSAFGSILSSGPRGALWKQRLTFVAWKQIHQSNEAHRTVSVGLVSTSAHIICSSKPYSMSTAMSLELAEIVLQGLCSDILLPGVVRKVVLAAVVKLLSFHHPATEKNLLNVVTGVLRSYATTTDTQDIDNIVPCKLLALQALESIAALIPARGGISPVKPAIISILEQAMNDKSSILRHAAVGVRNSWYVI